SVWYLYICGDLRRDVIAIFMVLFSIYLVIQSTSGTGMISLIILMSLSVTFKLFLRLSPQNFLVASIFGIITSIILILYVSSDFSEILGFFGKDPTLTGRTGFWPILIDKILERPFQGYGYFGFWQPWREADNPAFGIVGHNGFVPPHSHSGFLALGLDFGLTGILLFFLSFMTLIRKLFSSLFQYKTVEVMVPILLLVSLVTQNTSEEVLFTPNHFWFFYVLLSVRISADELIRKRQKTLLARTSFVY
ncbi:MAG TPA: O-antigen ligase family protein, partial [Phormidium sp.]